MTLEMMKSEYFDWLCDIVCKDRFSEKISYRKSPNLLFEKV